MIFFRKNSIKSSPGVDIRPLGRITDDPENVWEGASGMQWARQRGLEEGRIPHPGAVLLKL